MFNPFIAARICISPAEGFAAGRCSGTARAVQHRGMHLVPCSASGQRHQAPQLWARPGPAQRERLELSTFPTQHWHLQRFGTQCLTNIKNYNRHTCWNCICIALMVTYIYMSIYMFALLKNFSPALQRNVAICSNFLQLSKLLVNLIASSTNQAFSQCATDKQAPVRLKPGKPMTYWWIFWIFK